MKMFPLLKYISVVSLIFTFSTVFSVQAAKHDPQIKPYSLPLTFVENKGQIKNESVRYYARTLGSTAFLTKDGELVYAFRNTGNSSDPNAWVLKERLLNASIDRISGDRAGTATISHFSGQDKTRWLSNIVTHTSLDLGEIYKGIGLTLKAYGDNIEKLFVVNPGASPQTIRVRMEGGTSLSVDKNGELLVTTDLGDVRFTKPVAYQDVDGERQFVGIRYQVVEDHYGFVVAQYDPTKPLVIDPLLASTFLGGGNEDAISAVAVDANGDVVVTGRTLSADFPTTTGAWDTSGQTSGVYGLFDDDTFVAKLSPDLTTLLAATYLAGGNQDMPRYRSTLAFDSNGNVYLSGYTNSSDFPTTATAFSTSPAGGFDAFVAKLDSSLGNLMASTFLGGSASDQGYDIAVGVAGDIYVLGSTGGGGFPTTAGAFDTSYNGGSQDLFVSRFNSDLSQLLGSTYLGGANADGAFEASLSLSPDGRIFLGGTTQSSDFPTTAGAFDTSFGGGIGTFVSALDSSLGTLMNSTFFDSAYTVDIAVGGSGDVFIFGQGGSSITTTSGAFDTTHNGANDFFVSKFDGSLQSLLASTYVGGSANDIAYALELAADNTLYVTGLGDQDFPTTSGAYSNTRVGILETEIVIARLSNDLSDLLASTFFGGGVASALTTDANGDVYITGSTTDLTFATTAGAFQPSLNTSIADYLSDGFISQIDAGLSSGGGGGGGGGGTPPDPTADLAVSMTDTPDPARRNKPLLYSITVVNNGPDTAAGAQLTDTLPSKVKFVSVTTSQGSCSGTSTVSCQLGDLTSGSNAVVEITVSPTRKRGTLENTVSVQSATDDPDLDNNSATTSTNVRR